MLLTKFVGNHDLHQEWATIKKTKKQKLAIYIKEKTSYTICLNSMFDVHVCLPYFLLGGLNVKK